MRTVNICKASPLTAEVPDTHIIIGPNEPSDTMNLEESRCFHMEQASKLATALQTSLPQGTLEEAKP